MSETVVKTKEEWKKLLPPEQFHILREKGTERAFSGKYDQTTEHGIYRCAGCGLDLFRSEDKFDSGTGWPSFTAPIAPENIITRADNSLFTHRTEVLCRHCKGHIGHVFDNGPKPTGLRYCMNSASFGLCGNKEIRLWGQCCRSLDIKFFPSLKELFVHIKVFNSIKV